MRKDIFGMPKLDKAHPCVIRWSYGFPTGDGWDSSMDTPWSDDPQAAETVYPEYAAARKQVEQVVLPELQKLHTGYGTWVEYVLIQDIVDGRLRLHS